MFVDTARGVHGPEALTADTCDHLSPALHLSSQGATAGYGVTVRTEWSQGSRGQASPFLYSSLMLCECGLKGLVRELGVVGHLPCSYLYVR